MEPASEEKPAPFDPARAKRTLWAALIEARARFGAKRAIAVDGDGRTLNYDEIVRAALALGHALKAGTRRGEAVGVLLPTGLGSLLAFFALTAYGRVPAMLNFTAGEDNLHAALASAQVKRVVTARRFIALGRMEAVEAALKPKAELIYLEDVRERLSLRDKAAAGLGSYFPGLIATVSAPNKPATILFTSGTEGEPKGVVLSHANILANVEQVRAHLALHATDILFNPLPTFHSFGLTVGTLVPLFLGVKAVFHPTPRQPRDIVRRVRENRATILLSTDTFITHYARAAEEGDLDSLRLAVCGAERLRDETRALVRRISRVELLEGYGVTEASPVVAANRPGANRPGTVGCLMAGLEARIETVDGIPQGGRLLLKGPNVMLGYLHHDRPGEIVPPPEGWHDTGDVVSFDENDYLVIRGRLKRYAKIGGETVSLSVVENCAGALWPDFAHAAIACPDERKGEQIVLVTTNPEATRDELAGWVRSHGVPDLATPRRLVHVADIPLLGTGKTDYVAVARLAASP